MTKNTCHLPLATCHLDKLESQSIFIFREAFHAIDKLAMLWSFGKDSNVMIHLARKAFFGRVPFPLIHCDTGLEMDEVYKFRDTYARAWEINLISHICPHWKRLTPPCRLRPASRRAKHLV